jgi:predicted GNAT family acetyltransferase
VQVRRFQDATEFYRHVEPFLLVHEAEHNLLFGIMNAIMTTNSYQLPPYLACVQQADEVVAVAMRTPPYNLLLSNMADPSILQWIAQDVQTVFGELRGVLGTKALSKSFADIWEGLSGQKYHLNFQQRIYRLEQVNPVSGVTGEYRKPTEDNRELLVQWIMDFSAEAVENITREEAERNIHLRLTSDPSLRGVRLWYDGGVPVSFAGYSGPTPNGIRIGPVYTPPEYRGRGYASACVAALSQELLDQGRKFVFLFTDLSNPTSNHIYQDIGYMPVSDVDEYRFEANPKKEQG